jgi:hypothetical protein
MHMPVSSSFTCVSFKVALARNTAVQTARHATSHANDVAVRCKQGFHSLRYVVDCCLRAAAFARCVMRWMMCCWLVVVALVDGASPRRVCLCVCVWACVCVLVAGGWAGGSMSVHDGPRSKLRAQSCELNPSSLELLEYLQRMVKRLRIRGPAQRLLRSCWRRAPKTVFSTPPPPPPPNASHVVRRDPSSPRSPVC